MASVGLELTTLALGFARDIIVGIVSNLGSENLQELFKEKDARRTLHIQARKAYQRAIKAVFDSYISAPPFERLELETRQLVAARRDWLEADQTAKLIVPNFTAGDLSFAADQVSKLLFPSRKSVSKNLFEKLEKIGAIDGLPQNLIDHLQEGLIIGIQVEFVHELLSKDNRPIDLILLNKLHDVGQTTTDVKEAFLKLQEGYKNLLDRLPEGKKWKSIQDQLTGIHEELRRLPEITASAVVERLHSFENVESKATKQENFEARVATILRSILKESDYGSSKLEQLDESTAKEFQITTDLVKLLLHRPAHTEEEYLSLFITTEGFRDLDHRYVTLSAFLEPLKPLPVAGWFLVPDEQAPNEYKRIYVPDILKVIDDKPRHIILGEPGSGKTTVLRHLAMDAARSLLSTNHGFLPILVSLAEFSELEEPEDFLDRWLKKRWGQYNFQELLKYRKIRLLLDGVNEMPIQNQRDYRLRIAAWKEFITRIPDEHQVVFSCRSLDYSLPLDLQQVEIEPLIPEKVKEFLDKYLAPDKALELWEKISTEPQLLELFNTPFALWILTQLGGAIPENRASLFTYFVRHVLAREHTKNNHLLFDGDLFNLRELGYLVRADLSRVPRKSWLPSDGIFISSVENLSENMNPLGANIRIQRKVARTYLGKSLSDKQREDVLQLGYSTSLLDESVDVIFFSHQLLQEYFAGRKILNRFKQGEDISHVWKIPWVTDPIPIPGDTDYVGKTPTNGWEEALVFAVGLDEGEDLITAMFDSGAIVQAGRCIVRNGKQQFSNELVQRVIEGLYRLMIDKTSAISLRADAGQWLDALGWVPSDLYQFIRIPSTLNLWSDAPGCSYWISKYPITNRQIERFRLETNFTPRIKKNNRELQGYPVVSVGLEEAFKYAEWVAKNWDRLEEGQFNGPIPKDWFVTLPSVEEWIWAAGGIAGGRYPWGRDWHPTLANTGESKLFSETPVTMYPDGMSPFGVMDMAGNIFEETRPSGNRLFLMSSSFKNDHIQSRVVGTALVCNNADINDNQGFRLCIRQNNISIINDKRRSSLFLPLRGYQDVTSSAVSSNSDRNQKFQDLEKAIYYADTHNTNNLVSLIRYSYQWAWLNWVEKVSVESSPPEASDTTSLFETIRPKQHEDRMMALGYLDFATFFARVKQPELVDNALQHLKDAEYLAEAHLFIGKTHSALGDSQKALFHWKIAREHITNELSNLARIRLFGLFLSYVFTTSEDNLLNEVSLELEKLISGVQDFHEWLKASRLLFTILGGNNYPSIYQKLLSSNEDFRKRADGYQRLQLQSCIALGLAKIGERDFSEGYLSEATRDEWLVEEPHQRASILTSIGSVEALIREPSTALRRFEDAWNLSSKVENPWTRANLQENICIEMSKVGFIRPAIAPLAEFTKDFPNSWLCLNVLHEISAKITESIQPSYYRIQCKDLPPGFDSVELKRGYKTLHSNYPRPDLVPTWFSKPFIQFGVCETISLLLQQGRQNSHRHVFGITSALAPYIYDALGMRGLIDVYQDFNMWNSIVNDKDSFSTLVDKFLRVTDGS